MLHQPPSLLPSFSSLLLLCLRDAAVKQVWFVIPSGVACYQTTPVVVIKRGAQGTISRDKLDGLSKDTATIISRLPNRLIINKKSLSFLLHIFLMKIYVVVICCCCIVAWKDLDKSYKRYCLAFHICYLFLFYRFSSSKSRLIIIDYFVCKMVHFQPRPPKFPRSTRTPSIVCFVWQTVQNAISFVLYCEKYAMT